MISKLIKMDVCGILFFSNLVTIMDYYIPVARDYNGDKKLLEVYTSVGME